jgi:cyclopropane-fatty-acyl-phospholipid synthase
MFENGSGCNFQVQYVRDRNALPITRDYIAQAEARYREIAPVARAAAKPATKARRAKAPELAK